jgi:hypothetical protein
MALKGSVIFEGRSTGVSFQPFGLSEKDFDGITRDGQKELIPAALIHISDSDHPCLAWDLLAITGRANLPS